MSTIIPIGVLQKDIAIYQKMSINPKYLDELKEVEGITTTLGIGTISLYYCYQMVLSQLENYSYYEATILKRLEDKNYFDTVKLLSSMVEQEKEPVEKEEKKVKSFNLSNVVPFRQKKL